MRATSSVLGALSIVGAVLGTGTAARAFHVEVRWVQRIGMNDIPIGGDGAVATFAPGTSHRIRIQFGVFDDADGPAPAGGYIGWNAASLATSGGLNTRTPGRLSPFNFAPNPPANGLPGQDPFGTLTAIDNTLGTQGSGSPGFPSWVCRADGTTPPPPNPVIRGINSFISTFELTTLTGQSGYLITLSGNTVVASGWGMIGTPTPPDCPCPPEGCDLPGSVLYAPMTLPPTPITATLTIVVPAPGAALAICGVCGLIIRRRR